jgi:hypothetical protein
MHFYPGKSEDGSDMQEVPGVYVNPDNPNEWSAYPYPSQIRELRMIQEIRDYMDGRYSFNDVYRQIQDKTCPLPKRLRDYVLSYYDGNGNLIPDEESTQQDL